jgi:hypothetical protein
MWRKRIIQIWGKHLQHSYWAKYNHETSLAN